jgi:hypothetical protein
MVNLLDTEPKRILGGGRVSWCNAATVLSIEFGLRESLVPCRRVAVKLAAEIAEYQRRALGSNNASKG